MTTTLHSGGDRSLSSLVDLDNGLINRELYTNPDIYKQEMEQIYARCWLFVGHESQVPNPGDFMVSRMGEEEVLMTRDRRDRRIHVFLNSCPHKGMKVCRYDEGNALVHTCPFHGWSFDSDGRLVGVAYYREAYQGKLDKSQWGLHEVAQLCNFYGSIWATWDPKAPSFEDYVGAYASAIQHCFQSTDGEDNGIEVFRPTLKWYLPTNWKVGAFSFANDSTHAAMTHRSYPIPLVRTLGESGTAMPDAAPFPAQRLQGGNPLLGHGGGMTLYDQTGAPDYDDRWQDPEIDEYYRMTAERKKKKYEGKYMPPGGHGGGHFAIFPNVVIDDWRILPWHPSGVGETESWRIYQVDKNAPKKVKEAEARYVERFCGPIGMVEADDMENWSYAYLASRGVIAQRLPYNFQQQLGQGKTHERAPGFILTERLSEEPARNRFKRWLAFMEAGSWDDLYPVNKSAGR